MSRSSMTYSIAHDIHEGIMTKEEAIADCGDFERTWRHAQFFCSVRS